MNKENKNNQTIAPENNENVKPEVSDLQSEAINTKKLQSIGVIAFAFVILILVGMKFLSKEPKEPGELKEKDIGTKIEKKNFDFKEEQKKFTDLIEQTQIEDENTSEIFTDDNNDNPFTAMPAKTKFIPKVLKGSSSLLIGNSETTTNTNTNSNNESEKPIDFTDPNYNYSFDENGQIVKTPKNEFSKDYDLGTFSPKAASVNKYDPNLLLPKGTYIGCSLNTKLVSTIKGGISCTVSENVYSQNGNTLLIEKGSKITGFFNSGQMNDGMDRIFVVWQEIRTPNNIDIPVSSGATDELGGSGIQGYVDHHWLQRFGAAILLSVIDDAMNVALNGGSGTRSNQNEDYTENTRETARDMANTALQKFINIEPTLYKNQGDLVGVYVNRDIDFSKVYKLRYTGQVIKK